MKQNNSTIKIIKNEPMARHTSWRTGGVAKQFVQAKSLEQLVQFMRTLPKSEAVFWLGLGSNTLVRDGGYNGTVIATQGVMNQLEMITDTTVLVGAGVAGAKLARYSHKQGLVGAEFFAGIPGLIGGALAMNAGAFGCETWPLVQSVKTINREGEIKKYLNHEIKYSYRHVNIPKDEWFVSANVKLSKKETDDNTIDIKSLLAKRAATQPTGVASCGSVFKNPNKQYAAKLIESCGLKGVKIGGAIVSEKHANFILNNGNATADDIEKLIKLIQEEVNRKHQVQLQTEVKVIGEKLDKKLDKKDANK